MKINQVGFSVVEGFIVFAVIGIVGVAGAVVYQKSHTAKPTLSSTTAKQTPASLDQQITDQPGTTQAIDAIVSKDASSEATIAAQSESNEQSAEKSTNVDAANLGDAYNESDL